MSEKGERLVRKMICDKCGSETKSLYTFSIKFNGEPTIGGASLTWDGPKNMMMIQNSRRRLTIELCRRCAGKLLEVAGGFLKDEKKDYKKEDAEGNAYCILCTLRQGDPNAKTCERCGGPITLHHMVGKIKMKGADDERGEGAVGG